MRKLGQPPPSFPPRQLGIDVAVRYSFESPGAHGHSQACHSGLPSDGAPSGGGPSRFEE